MFVSLSQAELYSISASCTQLHYVRDRQKSANTSQDAFCVNAVKFSCVAMQVNETADRYNGGSTRRE